MFFLDIAINKFLHYFTIYENCARMIIAGALIKF